jgi:hypothetical protein
MMVVFCESFSRFKCHVLSQTRNTIMQDSKAMPDVTEPMFDMCDSIYLSC